MGDVEEGLAVGARELDLGGIDAVGGLQLGDSVAVGGGGVGGRIVVVGGRIGGRGGGGGELGREHLGQVAGRARELHHSPPHAEYHPAAGAPDLHALLRRSDPIGSGQRRRRRRRRRGLLRHDLPGSVSRLPAAKSFCAGSTVTLVRACVLSLKTLSLSLSRTRNSKSKREREEEGDGRIG